MLVTAATLASGETFTFDGSQELDGRFTVLSGGGNDTITGGALKDYLDGGAGADTIDGGGGNDNILGRAGADTLIGGAGLDYFHYQDVNESNAANGIDKITDFTVGAAGEKIDLSGIDANTGVGATGNQAFTFIGTNTAFHNVAGELRVVNENGNWFVQGDTDGDGNADLIIQIVNGGDIPLWGAQHFLL
jgi:Ca2+-binding RTX toxin-like protein